MQRMCVLSVIGCVSIALLSGAENSSALFDAVRNNNLKPLKSGLAKPADADARNAKGVPLVMYAAAFGSPEGLRMVVDAGADVNARNSFDATALMWAAGNPAKARLLIERGADVNVRSKQGRTALIIAAAHDGGAATVRLLLEKGADPRAKDSLGYTALLAAAGSGDTESVRLLVEKGADVNAADILGDTPLAYAAADLNLPAVKLLLAKGARVNDATTDGGPVKFGKIQLIQMTPLMFAAPYASPQLMQTLLDAGAKVNAKDCRGMTPLMLAVASETQNVQVARMLLKAGAEANVKSLAGETALDWALKFGNGEMIETLRAAGAITAAAYTPPARKPATDPPAVQRAVESSLGLLQRTSTEFFKQAGCVGCHHQPITATAVSVARAAGYRIDDAFAGEQVAILKGGLSQSIEGYLQRIDGPVVDIQVAMLGALHDYNYAPDAITDAVITNIAAQQRLNGSWMVNGVSRAPMEESNIARTARAARLLKVYAIPARQAEFEERIGRARTFLLESQPKVTDDFAARLLGLAWTGASKSEITKTAQALLERQRPDGGWAGNANLPSDAFATGESLCALRESGFLAVADPAYQRGVQYLLSRQFEDGSWYVRSRAPKFQPYFQSGFPFDHDQWISASATGYAVAALAPAGSVSALAQTNPRRGSGAVTAKRQ